MDEHPEFGELFDPEEEHENESRRPSPRLLVLMAVTGLIIVVIAVAAGISAVTDKGSDSDPVTSVRVGGPVVGDLAATTTAAVPVTAPSVSTSAAPEKDPFATEFASRSATVPRMDELTELEARGHARTMCLRLDSRVPEQDILKEAEDGGLNPAVARELLEIATLTVCPEHGDGSAPATP